MRYEQLLPPPDPDDQLNEVRMGASDLDRFVNSPEAEGIRAGFEAELCFPGKGDSEPDYDNPEEDFDSDTRPDSIDEICDFFYDGDYNDRRTIQRARERMRDEYSEWLSDAMNEQWGDDGPDRIRNHIISSVLERDPWIENYLRDELDLDDDVIEKLTTRDADSKDYHGEQWMEAYDAWKDAVEDMLEEALNEANALYDEVYDEWRSDTEDELDESAWLRDQGYRWMSDVSGNYDLTWPYWNYPQNDNDWNESGAQSIGDDLRSELGVEVKVSSGYHSASRRPGRWIIEPDGSLSPDDSDDLACEIVSPPMPLGECLDTMGRFFKWAKDDMDAYSNESTGLHVGVSLPYQGGRVDFIKLALFLGDRHVLSVFDRASNSYAESAVEKIERLLSVNPDKISNALHLMRNGLIELASDAVVRGGFGKYTSINLKDDYIEFRSMGNDYMNQVPEVINTVKRYAYAMYIASRPDLHRREYATKLYTLLSREMPGKVDIIEMFSQYASGMIDADTLKSQLARRELGRAVVRGKVNEPIEWDVAKRLSDGTFTVGIRVVARTPEDARQLAIKQRPHWDQNDVFKIEPHSRVTQTADIKDPSAEPLTLDNLRT